MDPITLAVLKSWDFRWEILLPLFLAGIVFTRGWQHLRRTGRSGDIRRLVAYWFGLITLALALLSPIDALAGQLFAVHMLQHLLLVMLVPPLLLLANPFPALLWGLPAGLRRRTGAWFQQETPLARGLRGLMQPGRVWFVFVAVFIGWHDPQAYNAALVYPWIHDLEHVSFFVTAILFWWLVIPAAPRVRPPLSTVRQIVVLGAVIPVNMLTGIAISFSSGPIYTYYNAVPRLWGLSVMQDQMLGGTIMWIPGSMMFLAAGLILATRYLAAQEQSPEGQWALGGGS